MQREPRICHVNRRSIPVKPTLLFLSQDLKFVHLELLRKIEIWLKIHVECNKYLINLLISIIN